MKEIRYHRDLLDRGVWIQYDCMTACKSGGRLVPWELDRRVQYLKQLVDEGHHRRILLSPDVSQRSHQAALGDPGLTFVLEEFRAAAVRAGIGEDVLHEMVVDNPRRAMFGQ